MSKITRALVGRLSITAGRLKWPRSHLAIALSLYTALCCLYLLTYDGVFHSIDDHARVALTESIARRGEVNASQIWWTGQAMGDYGRKGMFYTMYAPLPSLLMVPLYLVGRIVPWLGNIQAVALLNVGVTALTAALIYVYLVRLKYSTLVSLVTAASFGVLTTAFVYAKFLFSDPLIALTLWLTALNLLLYRQTRAARWAILGAVSLSLAISSKLVAVIFVPIFASYAFWRRDWRVMLRDKSFWITVGGTSAIIGGTLALLALYNAYRFASPFYTGRVVAGAKGWVGFANSPLRGLWRDLFSPRSGFFIYSPMLIAALAGFPRFVRQHRAEALLSAGLFIANALIYSLWRDAGGAWGQRYLMSIGPFVIVWLAPLFVQWEQKKFSSIVKGAIVILAILSLAVQFLGVVAAYDHVAAQLQDSETHYLPLRQQLIVIRDRKLDLLWLRRADTGLNFDDFGFLIPIGALITSALWFSISWQYPEKYRVLLGALLIPTLAAVIILYYYQERYLPAQQEFTELVTHLNTHVQRTDAVLISPKWNDDDWFYNYYTGTARWYGLREHNLSNAFENSMALLELLPEWHTRVWLYEYESKKALQPRPITTWLNAHAFPEENIEFAPQVRLLRYALPRADKITKRIDNMRVGAQITLDTATVFYNPPYVYTAFIWRTAAPLPENYSISIQLLTMDWELRAQQDGYPVNGTRPTTTWQPGETITDHHTLQIPATLPPGEYQLIARVYSWQTGANLAVTDAAGVDCNQTIHLGTVEVGDQYYSFSDNDFGSKTQRVLETLWV